MKFPSFANVSNTRHHLMRAFPHHILRFPCAAALSIVIFSMTRVFAQQTILPEVTSLTIHNGTYQYSEKRLVFKTALQQETIFENTNGTGGYLPPNQVDAALPVEFLDWGQSNGGTIEGFQIGYATSALSPISLKVKFYYGTDDTRDGDEIASFDLTNLPGSTSGQVEVFNIDVDISSTPFELPPGNFGYSYVIGDSLTGPLTADGGFGITDFYRLRPSLTNLKIAGFLAQFFLKLVGVHLQMIFVNNAGPDGDGSFFNPFNNLTRAALAAGAAYYIFVYAGNDLYDGGFIMKPGQKLIGEGAGLTHAGQVVVPPGQRPVITHTGGSGVILAKDTYVGGLNITNPLGACISADSMNGLNNFEGMTLNGGTTGINIMGGGGTFNFAGVDIRDQSDAGIFITGGSANLTFSGSSISENTGGAAIKITTGHSGTMTFEGSLSVTAGSMHNMAKQTLKGGPSMNPVIGLSLENSSGSYTIDAPVMLTGLDTGISILNNGPVMKISAKDCNFSNISGSALRMAGFEVNATFGSIEAGNTGGPAIMLDQLNGGQIQVAELKISGSGNDGVVIANCENLNFAVAGSTFITGAGGTAMRFNNTGGAFSFADITIRNAPKGGIAVVDSIGRILRLSMTHYAASDFDGDAMGVFVPLAGNGSSGQRAISWDEATLTDINGAAVRVQGTAIPKTRNAGFRAGRNELAQSGADSLAFGPTSITRADSGIVVRDADGIVNFKQVNIDSANAGIYVNKLNGEFAISGDGTPGSGGSVRNTEKPIIMNNLNRLSIQDFTIFGSDQKAVAGFGVLVVEDDADNIDIKSFVVNAQASPSDLSVFVFEIQELKAAATSSRLAIAGLPPANLVIANSTISGNNINGMSVRLHERANVHMQITGNTISTSGSAGLTVHTSDSSTALLTLTDNDVTAAGNDFVLIQESSSTFQLAGFAGGDASAVAAYVQQNNTGTPSVIVSGTISADPAVSVDERDVTAIPTEFGLAQNYPNPFNPATAIQFALPYEGIVTIRIFNLLGEEVRVFENLTKAAGNHVVMWDGRDKIGQGISSGIYIYQITYRSNEIGSKPIIQNRKMTLIR